VTGTIFSGIINMSKQGVFMKNMASAVMVVMILAAGFVTVGCGDSPLDKYFTLELDKGYIEFRSEKDAFTQSELNAIVAEINKLTTANFAEYAPYVARWTFQKTVPGDREITLNTDKKALITSNSKTAAGILADFAAGKIIAYKAQNPDPDPVDPIDITREGINFKTSGEFTQDEIDAIPCRRYQHRPCYFQSHHVHRQHYQGRSRGRLARSI
jgi:hypothetical protein